MPRPKKSKDERKAVLAVYLTPAVLNRLRDLATKDRRSASTLALIYIERCLEAEPD